MIFDLSSSQHDLSKPNYLLLDELLACLYYGIWDLDESSRFNVKIIRPIPCHSNTYLLLLIVFIVDFGFLYKEMLLRKSNAVGCSSRLGTDSNIDPRLSLFFVLANLIGLTTNHCLVAWTIVIYCFYQMLDNMYR